MTAPDRATRAVRRRRSGPLLALSAALFLGALVGMEHQDDGWLVVLGGRPVDLRGALTVAWRDLWRDCGEVRRPVSGDPDHDGAAQAVRDYSPPDSRGAEILEVSALGPWRLVQARFDRLEPVVVAVLAPGAAKERQGAPAADGGDAGPAPTVLPQAVWSGPTVPWNAAWRIRGFIAQRAPEVPTALVACLDPKPVFTTAAPDRHTP